MKTSQSCEVVFCCNNCNAVVNESETKLVLAQGLMMPIVPIYEGYDGRFGFSVILRVCPTCMEGLLSRSYKDFFKRAPLSEGFALADLDICRAGFDDQKGYYSQRVVRFPARISLHFQTVGDYERVPCPIVREEERFIWNAPEYLTIGEENRYYL